MHHHDALLLLAGSFKDQIVAFGPVEGDQLFVVDLSILSLHLDKARKLGLAYFTFKFSEVVVLSASNNLFFDFDTNPLS